LVVCSWSPLAQGGEPGRAGFDDPSREMSTCTAYFSLLAQRIKSTGQVMLTQSINVANYVSMHDDAVMEPVHAALKVMVDTVHSDPPSTLRVMHIK
jgi:hypothetical protein